MSALETPALAAQLCAVVSLETLRRNLALVRQRLLAGTELIACVKANAYGHGLRAVAGCLEAEGVRWLSLGSPAEALALRRWGVTCDILLFPTGEGGDPAPLLEAGITVGIQAFAEAAALARAARTRPPSIFLKVDSGLGRVGVPLADAVHLAARIRSALPGVRLSGVFTHLPFGGREGAAWVEERLAEFGRVVAQIRAATAGPLLVQALASAGIACGLEAPETNAVCPGQLLFGVEPAWLPTPVGTRPCSRKSGRRSARCATSPLARASGRAAAMRPPGRPGSARRPSATRTPSSSRRPARRCAWRAVTLRCSRSPWSTPSWT